MRCAGWPVFGDPFAFVRHHPKSRCNANSRKLAKNDRIERLVPIYEQGRWYELDGIIRNDCDGKAVNLTQAFIREEFLAFPVCKHDDILDAKARILDPALGVEWPKELPEDVPPEWMKKLRGQRRGWMSH